MSHMPKGSTNLSITSIIVIDSSITILLVFQCCYRNPTNRQPPSRQLLFIWSGNRLDMKKMAKGEGKK